MDQVIWIVALLFAFLVAPLALWSRRGRRRRRARAGGEIVPVASSSEPVSSAATRRLRRRAAGAGASTSSASPPVVATPAASSEPDPDDEGDEEFNDVRATYYRTKQSKKKNERKHEKEARREAEMALRDMRKEKQERQIESRRRRDEEREAEEREMEEEAERLKAKEEAESAAEFDKWKTAFSIETEGTQEQDTQEEGQGLLNDFVDYIKKHKCVALETLAAEFNLRTQDCINRVMALEQMGRISGVMDERGKFIYISPEEMKAVADYIKRLGRVSISHLAVRSNEFIDLESKSLVQDCAQEVNSVSDTTRSGSEITVV